MFKKFFLAVISLFTIFSCPLIAEEYYEFITLDTFGGATGLAYGINDNRKVVGASTNAYGWTKAFLWDKETGMVALDIFIDGDAAGTSINNSMQIVGGGADETTSWEWRGFLWEDESYQTLDTLGGDESLAWKINEDGYIVGHAEDVNGKIHACLWRPDLTIVDLGFLYPSTVSNRYSEARDINSSGQIVGFSWGSNQPTRGFLINPEISLSTQNELNAVWYRDDNVDGANDLMIDLGTFYPDIQTPYDRSSRAYGINDKGWVTGYSDACIHARPDELYIACYQVHAFLIIPENDIWFRDDNGDDVNDLMIDLGGLPGYIFNMSYGINNHDIIIGGSQTYPATRDHAFIYRYRDPERFSGLNRSQMADMNNLMETDSWLISTAFDINNNNDIVGYAYKSYENHAFIALYHNEAEIAALE